MGGLGSGPPRKKERDRLIVAHYRSGLTLRECAALFAISLQRVHKIVRRDAPCLMREPYVVPSRRRRRAAHRQAPAGPAARASSLARSAVFCLLFAAHRITLNSRGLACPSSGWPAPFLSEG